MSSLELIAKTVVSGFISGLHRAPYLGLSSEFAEHRAYMPGDDVRRIDWRVYGRTDRLFVREYQAETNANLTIALDVSKFHGLRLGGHHRSSTTDAISPRVSVISRSRSGTASDSSPSTRTW